VDRSFPLRLSFDRRSQSGGLLEDLGRRALELIGDGFKGLHFCQLYQLAVVPHRPPRQFAGHSKPSSPSPSVPFQVRATVTGDQPLGRMFDVTFWWSPCDLEKPSLEHQWRLFLIERDTDPTRLSPDNVTMVIAVLCGDNQVE
jgi:hypothetical protein